MTAPADLPGRWRDDPLLAEERRERLAGSRVRGDDRALLLESPRGEWLGLGDPAVAASLVRAATAERGGAWPLVATLPAGTWPLLGALRARMDAGRPGGSARAAAASYSAWEWHLLDGPPACPPRWREVVELDPAGTPEDRHDLGRLQARVLPEAYLALDAPGARWFGWRDAQGVLRGLGGARGWDRYAHLGSIGTDPAWRGRGIGAAVTAAMCHEGAARTGHVSLSVYSANHGALGLYESLGFIPVHRFVTRRQEGLR